MPSFKSSIAYIYGTSGSDIFRGILFPIYASKLGYNDLQIGLLLTIYTVVTVLMYYPASLLTEKYGAKLSLYITQTSYFLCLAIIFSTTSYLGLVIANIVLGITQAFIVQRNTLILANVSEQKELSAIYSSANGASLIGRLMGSLGVALLYFAPAQLYIRLSFLALGFLWLTPLPIIRGLKDTNKAQKLVFSPQRSVLTYSVVSLITGFGENIIITLLQLYYSSLGVNLLGVGLIYVLTSVTGYAGTFFSGKIGDRVVAGYLGTTVVYAITAPLIGLPTLYSVIALSVYSFMRYARNTLGSVMRGVILKTMKQVEKGYGTSSITSSVGDSAGTFLEGYLFNLGEYDLPFIIGSVTMVCGSLLHYYFYAKYRRVAG